MACLDLVSSKDPKCSKIEIAEGINAVTGEVTKPMKTGRFVLIPMEMSAWHEMKFLSGHAILRSCLITREGNDWYMCGQFEFTSIRMVEAEGVLGLDRGCSIAIAGAITDMSGAVQSICASEGNVFRDKIRNSEKRNSAHQQRKGTPRKGHKRAVEQALHEMANEVVAIAKSGRYAVAVEKLDGFKQTITQRRKKGARKGGWRKSLKAMQIAEFERILTYKLTMAGLPPLVEVVAAGTSQTCSACGHRNRDNRKTQADFDCVKCSYAANADINAAAQIARRGVLQVTKKIKKGVKLDALHANMVRGLASGDGGLGPLAATAANGFVAGLDSERSANERACSDLRPDGSKNSVDDRQNAALLRICRAGDLSLFRNFKDLRKARCGTVHL